MTKHEKVAENVRAALARKSIKMTQLSTVLEVGAEATRLKVNGKTPITLDEVGIIADYLGISFTDLLEGVDDLGANEN